MSVPARYLGRLLRVALITLLVLLMGLAAALWYVQRDPQGLLQSSLQDLQERTGLHITMESVDVALLPLPSLAVSNAVVQGAGLRFSVGYATLTPNFAKLLLGQFAPGHIMLLRPVLEGDLPLPLGDMDTLLTSFSVDRPKTAAASAALPLSNLPALFSLLEGCHLQVAQGHASIAGQDDSQLALNGLHCDLRLDEPARLAGLLGWQQLILKQQDRPWASLEELRLEGVADLLTPLQASQVRGQGRLRLLPWLHRLSLAANLHGGEAGWNLHTRLQGDLDKDGEMLPFALAGDWSCAADESQLRLANMALALGQDSGELHGKLWLPGSAEGFRLDGSLALHRASLTQWLGFARRLAPGLQLALDNLTSGRLDFRLDSKGLEVPRIEVTCCGARFQGHGGVASWDRPVVALDLTTQRVDLGLAIPEAVGKPPESPRFFHAALTPDGSSPLQPGEVGIGYDIRLQAKEVDYGPLRITNGAVRISPDPEIRKGFRDCRLTASGDFYDGKLDGSCVLGGSTEVTYAIRLRATGINGSPLARVIRVLPLRQGRYEASIDIKSQGRTLDRFLQKLSGNVIVQGKNGALGLPDDKEQLPFHGLEASLDLQTAAWSNGRLGLDGRWKVRLVNQQLSGNGELNGRLWFGADRDGKGPVLISGVPLQSTLELRPPLTGLTVPLSLRLAGRLGCQANAVALADAQASTAGMTVRGSVRFAAGKGGSGGQHAVRGSIRAQCPDIRASLQQLGLPAADLPQALRDAVWQSDFSCDSKGLELQKLDIALGGSRLVGSLKLLLQERPRLSFELDMDRCDIGHYLPDKEKQPSSPSPPAATHTTWDFPFLRDFDATGLLRIRLLQGWKFRLEDIRLPLKLEKGLLQCGPYGGRFYGATMRGQARIDFRTGLRFDNTLEVNDFDLAAASQDMNGTSALRGQGSIQSELRASLTGPGQMPRALDGHWGFNASKGSYQERDSNGRPKGSPTYFDVVAASGNIQGGVCRSGDLKLLGPELDVRGGGLADLNTRTLDCNLTVNMGSLKNIPVRLYGSLDAPKTSIGAGKLIFAAIGGMVHGFMDVLGGIFEGTWKLFR